MYNKYIYIWIIFLVIYNLYMINNIFLYRNFKKSIYNTTIAYIIIKIISKRYNLILLLLLFSKVLFLYFHIKQNSL